MERGKRELIKSASAGDSEMATRMRMLDWSATPFGTVKEWPQALRTSVRMMLSGGYAMATLWGRTTRTNTTMPSAH